MKPRTAKCCSEGLIIDFVGGDKAVLVLAISTACLGAAFGTCLGSNDADNTTNF